MDKTWTQDLLDFLDRSPTCYHAVAELAAKLTAAGYRPLQEHEPWTLTPGQGYFVIRGQASLAAFRVPEGPWRGFAIAAAHSDSPTFKVREEAEVSGAGKTVRLSDRFQKIEKVRVERFNLLKFDLRSSNHIGRSRQCTTYKEGCILWQ